MILDISNKTALSLIEYIDMANNEGVWGEEVEALKELLKKKLREQ